MEKLKKINIEKIIIGYILIQPILDAVTSLCLKYVSSSLTLGILVRTIFMGAIIIYSLLKIDKKSRIKSLIYYGLVGIYMCIFLFVSYSQTGTNMILVQLKGLIKAFYFPLVLVALYNLFNSETIKIDNKYFLWSLAEYSLIMFITRIMGIAYPTYNCGSNIGTVGLFYAANEIGSILSIISPILAIELLKDKKINIINLLILMLFIFSVLEMGTKVPFSAFVMLYLLFLIICFIKIFVQEDKKIYIRKSLFTLLVGVIILFLLPYTPIAKNIERNYGTKFITISEFLANKNHNPGSHKRPESIKNPEKQETEETIDIGITEVVSGRNEFLKNNLERYRESSVTEKIFGNGYLSYKNNELQINKLVEIDYFDIFFSHGIVGTILFSIPLIYVIMAIIIKSLKHIMKIFKNEGIIFYWYSIGAGLGITLLAGHVLTAPAVSIYIILILLKFDAYLEKLEVKN